MSCQQIPLFKVRWSQKLLLINEIRSSGFFLTISRNLCTLSISFRNFGRWALVCSACWIFFRLIVFEKNSIFHGIYLIILTDSQTYNLLNINDIKNVKNNIQHEWTAPDYIFFFKLIYRNLRVININRESICQFQ